MEIAEYQIHSTTQKRNLISVSQIDDDGYTTVFGSNSWEITEGNRVMARGSKVGTLYMTAESKDTVAMTDW